MHNLDVAELFYSIQGESTFSGFPCVFIRLAGCNLRCSYCDAQYTYTENPSRMSLGEIISFTSKYPGTLIEITGGEPLLQPNLHNLLEKLLKHNRIILVETNGSLDISTIPVEVTVIMDIKCPDSGASSSLFQKNITTLKARSALRPGSTEIKFVISSHKDYEWSKKLVLDNKLCDFAPILFSPVNGKFDTTRLAEALLHDKLPVRLQLQLHTFIWPNTPRGV